MPKFVIPDGKFTLNDLVRANPTDEASVKAWFVDQVAKGNIEVVDSQSGIFEYLRNQDSE